MFNFGAACNADGSPVKVILAEDVPEIRIYFDRVISRRLHVNVEVAVDGRELREKLEKEKLEKEKFDIIISDIMMPYESGDSVLESVDVGDTPIVILSAIPPGDIVKIAERLVSSGRNIIAAETKPVTMKRIKGIIREFCERS